MNQHFPFNQTSDFDELLARQKLGFCLEQAFYVDEDIYKIDIDRILAKQWIYVDHISKIPNQGDYIVHDIGNDSIIITRTMDDEVKAFFNVCRHRGSRLCLKEQGHAKRLVCPYHAWLYDLNGNLLVAKQMPDDFDKNDYNLHPCNLEILEGLIFINIDGDDASDFDELRKNLTPFIKPHGVTKAKIAHSHTYSVAANWKLAVENFRECYHCTPSHPEYSSINAYVSAGDKDLGGYLPEVEKWIAENADSPFEKGFKNFTYGLQPHHAWRMPIKEGFKTATQDGEPAGPLMGDFKEYDCAETGIFFGPTSYFYLNNDHLITFRITPKSPIETDVTVTWLVHEDAVEGTDYDVDHVKWLWHETTVEDGDLTVDNQNGVISRFYQPGPYSKREYGTADFVSWYIARLQGKPDERHLFR